MKVWNFKADSNAEDISEKLESALGPINGFVFDSNHDHTSSITFKIRKRILYGWYMVYHNWTVVNGKLLKINTENKTNVEISFTQHFLIQLIIFSHLILGLGLLIMITIDAQSSISNYIPGALLLGLGIVLWIAIQKKFNKDIQNYKSLISEILEL